MSYMRDIDEHLELLEAWVKGRKVVDLGCGQYARQSLIMSEWRPPHILAVDKNPYIGDPFDLPRNIDYKQAYFCDLTPEDVQGYDLALLSWPRQYNVHGLEALLKLLPCVVYVGKNTDGTGCGSVELWEHLTCREVITYLPNPANVMIVYGPYDPQNQRTGDALYHEEKCGLDKTEMHSYEGVLDMGEDIKEISELFEE